MEDNKKYFSYSIIGVLLIIISVFGVTYAYLNTNNSLSGNDITVVKTDDLIINFKNGSEILVGNIKPGQLVSKTFEVKNNGTGAVNYNINWVYTENEFNSEENLVYEIIKDDKAYKEKQVPSTGSNIPILKNITVEKNSSNIYTINIKHKENGTRKNTNIFKGKLEIVENEEE